MAHKSFLQKQTMCIQVVFHAERHDLERCIQDLLRGGGSYLTEINLVYLDERK